jgi:CO/xanthine dehydrogenase FAD-binding subunit
VRLHEAIKAIGAIAIRNMATIGGNICNAAPPADTVPAMLIFDAQLKLVKLGSENVQYRLTSSLPVLSRQLSNTTSYCTQ